MRVLAEHLDVGLRDDLGEELHALGEPVLRGLRVEGARLVALQRDVAALGARLQDLRDVGRVVLVGDRRVDLVDQILADLLDLLLERGVAGAAPGRVGRDRDELLLRRVLEIERERARTHRRRGVGAEEARHEQLGGEPAVAVAVRDEDRVPLFELRQHGGGLGRDDDAGQDAAIVALDQLLALAHAMAGSPWVSWNRNSTGRPITPPLASVIFLTSRQVRITWLPSSA